MWRWGSRAYCTLVRKLTFNLFLLYSISQSENALDSFDIFMLQWPELYQGTLSFFIKSSQQRFLLGLKRQHRLKIQPVTERMLSGVFMPFSISNIMIGVGWKCTLLIMFLILVPAESFTEHCQTLIHQWRTEHTKGLMWVTDLIHIPSALNFELFGL